MKKILYFLGAFAAAAVCFSSCGEVELSVPETPGYHTVHFTANSADVKTVLAGDHANWVATDAALFHVFENGVEAEDIEVSFDGGIANVTALFPDPAAGTTEFVYSGFVGNENSNGNASVLAKQTPTDSSYDPNADILFAKPIKTTDNNESLSLEFQFTRVVALNKMTLKGIKEGETISKITLTGDKSIIGSFNKETMAYTSNVKTLELTTSENEVYFVTGPVEDVTLTVTVATDKASYSKTFAKTIDFVAGSLYEFGVTFTDEHRSTSDATYALVNNVSSLKAGDVIVLGNAEKGAAAGAVSSGYFTKLDATIKDGYLTSSANPCELTLGGSEGAWTFFDASGLPLVLNSANISFGDAEDTPTEWTITTSDGDATIASAADSSIRFLYNVSSPRFKPYSSKISSTMALPQIYKKGGTVEPVEEVHVSSVSLDESAVSVEVGETVTLVATVLPANADDKSVTWSSDDEDVATVSASGVVTGVAEGSATITVTTTDGSKTASCEVTVTASSHVYGTFDFAEEGGFSKWGTSYSEHVVEAPEATVTFASANKNTSTITDVPVTKGGDVVLELTEEGKQLASVALTTKQWVLKTQTITISASTDGTTYVEVGSGDQTNGASADIARDGIKFIKFSFSSDSQIGIVKLVFTTADYVEPAVVGVTGVTLNKTTASIAVPETLQLTATVAPENASNPAVTWSSNAESVATVSNTGLVSAVSAGTAIITATTVDGEFTASCTVTVTAASALTMNGIFAAATPTETTKLIKFENCVVTGVKGDNVYLTDGNGKGLIIYTSSHGFAVGDVLNGTVSSTLVLYNGSAELKGLKSSTSGLTVTKGGTVTPCKISIADLSGANTGAVITFDCLSYNGLAFSDGVNTITPYNAFMTLPSFTKGRDYSITGVYVQFKTTKEIAPRTSDDIAELDSAPYLTAKASKTSVSAAGETITITVDTNIEGWTATSDNAAFAVGAKSGNTVPVVVSANTSTTEGRTATITVSATGVSDYKIELTQSKASSGSGDKATYEILFKDSGTSSDGTAAKTIKSDLISDGGDVISSVSATKVYQAKSGYGIKLGASSAAGSLELTWNSSSYNIKPTKVILNIAMYDEGKAVKVSINGGADTTLNPGTSFGDCVIEMDGNTALSSIKVSSSANSKCRFYMKSITVTNE